MPLTFYPHSDDVQKGSLNERIEVLYEAAQHFKAVILDAKHVNDKVTTPREQFAAYNWEEISRIFQIARDLPQSSAIDKEKKILLLQKLSEVYEILRGAKMPKLETVRLVLMNDIMQLKGKGSQVA